MVQTPEREKPALSKHSHVNVTVSLDIQGQSVQSSQIPGSGSGPLVGLRAPSLNSRKQSWRLSFSPWLFLYPGLCPLSAQVEINAQDTSSGNFL